MKKQPKDGELECMRENIDILFQLNKRREREIEELRRDFYELKAEIRAYLLDMAEKGKDNIRSEMVVKEED